jgi:hypothetical protein
MENDPIIDSKLSLDEALAGAAIPLEIKRSLALINVPYISFDNLLHQGQLILHEKVAKEMQEIFNLIYELRFPIQHAIPIVRYNWDDEVSMEANNTSAFNYRVIYGTSELSKHSYGLALDINPKINPYITRMGTTLPPNSIYDPEISGTLREDGKVVELFTARGWEWGGNWKREDGRKDWQHFDKKLSD